MRPLKLAVLGLLLLGAAPQDPAPLSKEVADLVRRYSAVAEWRGSFWASETGATTWSAGGGDYRGSHRVESSSRGEFRIPRSTFHGHDPERGMLRWGAGNKQVSGDVVARDFLEVSSWHKSGSGSEYRDQRSGSAPLFASEFGFWLQSKYVYLRMGDPEEKFRFERVGRSVTEESRGNGTSRLKTTSLDRIELLAGHLPPLHTRFWTEEASYRVVSGGPGVLTFACQGVTPGNVNRQTADVTHRSSVTLFPLYDDVEVQVTIKDYEKWMPSGSVSDPSLPEAHLVANAVLVQKTKGPPPKVKRFRFELVEVSREPGVCMNWPRFGADGDAPPAEDPKPDLRFGPGNGAVLTKEDLAAELPPVKNPQGLESAAARVDCYDYGATADLRVICDLDDGREIPGILRTGGSELLSIPLPYRPPGSRIAQAWTERDASGADSDDADGDPEGDGTRGDGFSNYEEYRGFVMDRSHLRTPPGRKDLFVRNQIGERAAEGLGLLKAISRLEVRPELRADEMPESRHMNVNRSSKSPRRSEEHQCGVILKTVVGGVYSQAVIPQGVIGRPKTTHHVEILQSLFAPGNEAELKATIAHELLHSIGVLHHGDTDLRYVEWKRMPGKDGGEAWYQETRLQPVKGGWTQVGRPYRIRLVDGAGGEYRAQDDPEYLKDAKRGYVGCFQGEHSGDVDCVMRYRCAVAFRPEGGAKNDRYVFPEGYTEPVGWTLCTKAGGTDFNAASPGPSRYGDALLGNCVKRFCVRDDAEAPKAP